MKISYRATHFPSGASPLLKGNKNLEVTWPDLVWASMTAGKASRSEFFSYGIPSMLDTILRAFRVFQFLKEDSGRIGRTELYSQLDPTEKGNASYWCGMLVAKLVASHLLDTPWLMHLSTLRKQGGIVKVNGKSEPDLVGLTQAQKWVVLEAKGRSGGFDKGAMTKAKAQTAQLEKVNGVDPLYRVAVQAFFSPSLSAEIEDPPGHQPGAEGFQFPERNFLKAYYDSNLPGRYEFNEKREIRGQQFRFMVNEGMGVSIGIDSRVEEMLAGGNTKEVGKEWRFEFLKGYDKQEHVTLFPDGMAVALTSKWSSDQMRKNLFVR